MLKALLLALLEPTAKLRELERAGDFTARLAMLEECKTLPLAPCGTTTARSKTCPSARPGSTPSGSTSATC